MSELLRRKRRVVGQFVRLGPRCVRLGHRLRRARCLSGLLRRKRHLVDWRRREIRPARLSIIADGAASPDITSTLRNALAAEFASEGNCNYICDEL